MSCGKNCVGKWRRTSWRSTKSKKKRRERTRDVVCRKRIVEKAMHQQSMDIMGRYDGEG